MLRHEITYMTSLFACFSGMPTVPPGPWSQVDAQRTSGWHGGCLAGCQLMLWRLVFSSYRLMQAPCLTFVSNVDHERAWSFETCERAYHSTNSASRPSLLPIRDHVRARAVLRVQPLGREGLTTVPGTSPSISTSGLMQAVLRAGHLCIESFLS